MSARDATRPHACTVPGHGVGCFPGNSLISCSRFPEPRGAASTRWWLAYMELGRGDQFIYFAHGPPSEIRYPIFSTLFRCSGPDPGPAGDIVRIAPNEVISHGPVQYPILTIEFSHNFTLQDRRCTTRSTIRRTNETRITNITVPGFRHERVHLYTALTTSSNPPSINGDSLRMPKMH